MFTKRSGLFVGLPTQRRLVPGRPHGLTLIELIFFIVVVSVGLVGVMSVLRMTVMHSADPMINKQLQAIAEAYLEEISAMPFTYCDPDDANVLLATSSAISAQGCTTWPEAMGPEIENGNRETRGGSILPFDNVNDYAGYTANPASDASGTHTYPGYAVSVTIANDANLGPASLQIASAQVLRITVTVTSGSNSLTLEGYRTEYAPNTRAMNTMRTRQTGFTLVEAIMVIVITGIIAGIVGVFIKTSIDSYMASVRRAALTDAADATLRRLQRDLHLALPNSVRVTDSTGAAGACGAAAASCFIEFIPTSAGGLYRAAGDGSTGGTILDFTNTANIAFDVLGPVPAPLAVAPNGDYIAVYNLGPGYNPANAYLANSAACTTASSGCNIAKVNAIAGSTITLTTNPFANETPPLPSPNNRFDVVPNSGPVTYLCSPATAGAINRYTGYGFFSVQPTAFASTPALVEANATCQVDYGEHVLLRDGILFVSITVTDAPSGESITVFREIHVDNAP